MMLFPTSMVSSNFKRVFSTSITKNVKIAVCGACGGIGQPLSLLLKLSPIVTELSLYDIAPHTPGVAADLSHINVRSKTAGYKGPENIEKALKGVDIVVVPAGLPRKPGMTRDDLFDSNATIVYDVVEHISKHCPKALIGIITNPVNSMLPIAAEVLKKNGVLDPNKLFGVSTLDVIRASTFVGELKGLDPREVHIPVIGGHSGITIIPVLSQTIPKTSFKEEEIGPLVARIQNAGTEVVNAKAGAGSATLAMAFAGARFTLAMARGLKGEKNIVECSFVASKVTDSNYFATPILLGKNGLEKNLGMPKISTYESDMLKKAMDELKKNIKRGEDFVKNK